MFRMPLIRVVDRVKTLSPDWRGHVVKFHCDAVARGNEVTRVCKLLN